MSTSGMTSSSTSTPPAMPISDFLNNFHTQYDAHLRQVLQNNRQKLNDRTPKLLAPSKLGANGRKKRGKSKQGKSYFSRPSTYNAALVDSLNGIVSAYVDFDDEESEDERLAALNNVEQRTQLVKKMLPRKHKVVYSMKPAGAKGGTKSRSKKIVTSVTVMPSASITDFQPTYTFTTPTPKNTTSVETNNELIQTPFFDESVVTKEDLSLFQLKGDNAQDPRERLENHFKALESNLQNQMDAQEEDRLIVTSVEIYGGSSETSRREVFETLAKHFQSRKGESVNVDEMITQLEKRYEEIVQRNARKSPVVRTPNQFSVQDAWKSFDALFCIKCKIYDCQQHGPEKALRPQPDHRKPEVAIVNRDRVHALLGKMLELTIIQTMACDSPVCYKTTSDQSMDQNVPWNEDETVLLLRSIQVLGEELQQTVSVVDPFCALAALAVISCATPKTCKQVRDHLVKWHAEYTPSKESTKDEHDNQKHDHEQMGLLGSSNTSLPRLYAPCKCTSNSSAAVAEVNESCADSTCSCSASMNYCTKWCCDGQCSSSVPGILYNNCKNFFAGCTCTTMTCQSQACPCYQAGRECDPNICTTCDSLHTCHNRSLQRLQYKKIALTRIVSRCADSENDEDPLPKNFYTTLLIEKAAQGELITEFIGELVNEQELSRRSKYWNSRDKNASLACDLTVEYILDTHRMVNGKIKFLKTSTDPNVANVELRNVYVCGDYRLGIYAKRDLPTCTELVLDVSSDNGRFVRNIGETRSVDENKRGTKRATHEDEGGAAKRKKFTPKRLHAVKIQPPIIVEHVSSNDIAAVPTESGAPESTADIMNVQQE
jgi:hypothetical protein